MIKFEKIEKITIPITKKQINRPVRYRFLTMSDMPSPDNEKQWLGVFTYLLTNYKVSLGEPLPYSYDLDVLCGYLRKIKVPIVENLVLCHRRNQETLKGIDYDETIFLDPSVEKKRGTIDVKGNFPLALKTKYKGLKAKIIFMVYCPGTSYITQDIPSVYGKYSLLPKFWTQLNFHLVPGGLVFIFVGNIPPASARDEKSKIKRDVVIRVKEDARLYGFDFKGYRDTNYEFRGSKKFLVLKKSRSLV